MLRHILIKLEKILKVARENQQITYKRIPVMLGAVFFLFIFLLKGNCFTEFCYFLSNINMNQP